MDVSRQVMVGMASMAMLYGGGVHALGLGEIRLDSALHQPLNAAIALHDTDGLAPSDIVVSLADANAFARVGIDRSHFLTLLRFTPVLQGNDLVVQVQSNGPVVEPYLNFLIQLKRPHGTLLREYTLLLDPPMYQPTAIMAATPASAMAESSDVSPRPHRVPPAARVQPQLPQLQADPQAAHYQSRPGDNLWTIAKATRADAMIPVHRQMLAIRALNPDAFVNGDMDRLRAAQQLILPTSAQVGGESVTVVAAAKPGLSPLGEPATANGAAVVGETTETKGRLRIAEQVDSSSLENAELQERLATLESRFTSLLGELDIRDRQIASLQAELDVLRRARDAELDSPVVGAAEGATTNSSEGGAGSSLASNYESNHEPVAGSLTGELPSLSESAVVSSESQPFSMMNWWPALLALLATIAAVIIFRLGRGRNDHPQPADTQPVAPPAAPATKSVDALEGAELYLAYGRYAEARMLLDKAIGAEPRRLDLRLRQMAVLAQLGDTSAFATQELEALKLGGDAAQIEQLETQFAPAGYSEPTSAIEVESLPVDLLGQDDFNLDPDWSLLEDLDPSSARRQARIIDDQPNEVFETNLNDFPEVGELDDALSEHFADSKPKLSDS